MATNTLDQIKTLDGQRAKLLDGAKVEAMDTVQKALAELNALGFQFVVSEGSKGARRSVRERSNEPCPICKFKTSPPHDGRRHRAQGMKKKAFTNQELTQIGLTRAD
jgi:hypothetical protein